MHSGKICTHVINISITIIGYLTSDFIIMGLGHILQNLR